MLIEHPGFRTCADCQKWMYDKDGQLCTRFGLPVVRETGVDTPCEDCVKCDGSEEKSPRAGRQAELSAKNQKTLDAYFEAKATGQPIDDPLFKRHCGMIEKITFVISQRRARYAQRLAELQAGMP